MNKSLSLAHLKRTLLRNCYLKKRPEQNRFSYVKQRNYSVFFEKNKKQNKKTQNKKNNYANLNVKILLIISSFGEQ